MYIKGGINLFTDIMNLVALFLLLVSVIAIFLSRDIVRIKANIQKENRVVERLKIFGYILSILSLILIYFLNK